MKRRSKPGKAKKAVKSSKSRKAVSRKTVRKVVKSNSAKKPVKKSSRSPKVKLPPGQSLVSEPLEQVTVTCANCGRHFTVVKLPGLSMDGMICQRCELGEIESPE